MFKKKWNKLSSFRKKAFAAALSAAVISSTLNIGGYVVNAGTSVNGRVIASFEELPEDVEYQYLPVGSTRRDIVFPEELKVILYSDEDEVAGETGNDLREKRKDEEASEEQKERKEEASGEQEEGINEEAPGEEEREESTDETAVEKRQEGKEDEGTSGEEEPEENTSGSVQPEGGDTDNGREDGPSVDEKAGNESPEDKEHEEMSPDDASSTGEENEAPSAGEENEEASPGDGQTDGNTDTDDTGSTAMRILDVFSPVTVYAAEADTEDLSEEEDEEGEEESADDELYELPAGDERILKNVRWLIDRDRSEYGSRFQAVNEGDEFVFVPDISAYGLESDAELPEITVIITGDDEMIERSSEEASEATETAEEAGEDTEETEAATEEEEENKPSPAFSQFSVVGGIRISVEAPEGVFPEGSLLRVRQISASEENRIGEAIGGGEEVETLSFDITITDKDGNEIQPDTEKGEVTVTFSGLDMDPDNEVRVYHFDDLLSNAEDVFADVDTGEKTVRVNAESFSVYTVASISAASSTPVITPSLPKTVSVDKIYYTVLVKYNGKEKIEPWYNSAVEITADGYYYGENTARRSCVYHISTTPSINMVPSYSIDESVSNYTKELYFTPYPFDVSGNAPVTVGPLNFDKTAPEGSIKVSGKTWKSLQNKKKIYKYTNETPSVTIKGTDEAGGSGVGKIYYYISNKCYTSKSELISAAGEDWNEYDSKPGLKENKLNFAYAKILDQAGNETYVSSQGIWYDTKKPKVDEAKASPKDTSASVEVKGSDGESGIKYYYCKVLKKDDKKPKAEDVRSSGQKEENGSFDISGLTAQKAYVAYCVVEDKAGNLSDIKEAKINTKEAKSDEAKAAQAAEGGDSAGGGAAGGAGSGGDQAGGAGGSGDAGGKDGASGKKTVDERVKAAEESKKTEESKEEDTDIPDKIPYIEDASDGIMIGRENTAGWDRIEDETSKAGDPANVTVNMNGGTTVPKSLFQIIADRDVAVTFDMGEDVSWTVNGMSVRDCPEKSIDLGVRLNTKNIPSSIVNEVADVYPHTNITLNHDGEFGFTAIMSLNLGQDKQGLFANLYYYNEKNNSMEFISSSEVNSNGISTFDFTHASDYTVIVRGDQLTEKSAAALNAVKNKNDGNGSSSSEPVNVPRNDNRLWLIIISLISFLLCGLILFMPSPDRKKKGVLLS